MIYDQCRRGHFFTADNVHVRYNGNRVERRCRTCRNEGNRSRVRPKFTGPCELCGEVKRLRNSSTLCWACYLNPIRRAIKEAARDLARYFETHADEVAAG